MSRQLWLCALLTVVMSSCAAPEEPQHDRLIRDAKLDTVQLLTGPDLGSGLVIETAEPHTRALAFLTHFASFFRTADAAATWTHRRTEQDQLGFRQVRLAQQYAGLPVLGAELVVQIDGDDRITSVQGRYLPTPMSVDPQPTVDEQAAIATALFASQLHECDRCTAELAIAGETEPQLVWRVDVKRGFSEHMQALVDAHSGDLLSMNSEIQTP